MAENDLKVAVEVEISPEGTKEMIEENALTNKMLDDSITEIERISKENVELKAALTDLVKAYLTLSNACGAGIDALNNHAKIVMSLGVDLKAGG